MGSEQKGKRNNQQNKDLLKSVVVKNYSVPVWGLGALILVVVVLVLFVVIPGAETAKSRPRSSRSPRCRRSLMSASFPLLLRFITASLR